MKIQSKSPQLTTFHWIANLRDWFKQFWDRQQQAGFLWDRNPCLSFLQQVLDSTNKWFNQVETEFVRRRLQRQRNNRRGTIGLVVIGFALVWLFAGCQGSQNQQTQIDPIKNENVNVIKAEIRDYKVLNYLKSISGRQTVAGQHNKEPLSEPDKSTEEISTIISESPGEKKYPGLWSSDFLFKQDDIANRWTMINEAKEQWKEGAIINLMYHACPPTKPEPCEWKGEGSVHTILTPEEWEDLINDGGKLNKAWKKRLEENIVPFLQDLEKHGVEVLWRPLHEMNKLDEPDQDDPDKKLINFWWAGRPEYSRKLYQITHDYLVKEKGLTNLIWVWDLQDFETLSKDLKAYDPGDSYWDIAALDFYNGDGFTDGKYNAMVKEVAEAKGKPIAIGESDRLPKVEELRNQRFWTFFMGWPDYTECHESVKDKTRCNSDEEIRKLYNAPNILTRNEVKKGRG
jgi:mannan endo-1,4-beta-mannosidase